MTVEQRVLLRTVGRVIGRVQIDRDALGSTMKPLALTLDHHVGQSVAHSVEILAADRVLES